MGDTGVFGRRRVFRYARDVLERDLFALIDSAGGDGENGACDFVVQADLLAAAFREENLKAVDELVVGERAGIAAALYLRDDEALDDVIEERLSPLFDRWTLARVRRNRFVAHRRTLATARSAVVA